MAVDELAAVPAPSGRRIALRVQPYAERALREGHPWLYARAIHSQSHEGQPGDIAVVFDRKGRFLAAGLYDPSSPLRARLLVYGQPQDISADLFRERLRVAAALRAEIADTGTTAYRLAHGANDGLAGLVVDRYEDTAVIKLDTAAWIPHLPVFLLVLLEVVGSDCVVLRLSRRLQEQSQTLHGLSDGLVLAGPPPEGPIPFLENDLRFEADVIQGQKTGFFLDQRDNRLRSAKLAASRRVLNTFSYSGGFSLYAARGGAREVVDVDQSAPALAASRRHFVLNSTDPAVAAAVHETIRGDVFAVLEAQAAANAGYEMVILDPPSFARRQDQVPAALNAYRRLVRLGLAVLEPGGIMIASSCSSRVSAEEFFAVVHDAAHQSGRELQEIERSGHALDHPVRFAEGAYLKTLFARVG